MQVYALKIEYSRFRNESILNTRDLRALVLKFIDENSEYFRICNWHGKGIPRVIYSKPRNSFATVYTTLSDVADYLAEKIKKRFVWIDDKRIAVKGVKRYNLKWEVGKLTDKLYMYQTRTEIITGVNDTEWKINTAVKNMGSIEGLEKDVLKNIITRTVKHAYKNWFGFEPDLSELQIKVMDGKHFLCPYKVDVLLPSWRGIFLSNYSLPQFVGYKTGLGYGELQLKAELPKSRLEKILVA